MDAPLLLVTNDDGYQAPGLQALRQTLAVIGEVFVVAPLREASACGQSLTITRRVEAQEIEPRVFAVDGTPADCVSLAVVRLLGRRPDLVLSGINRGANLGEDVFYSGTVGGAREASFYGLPAVALSLATRGNDDYEAAAEFAARLARLILEEGLPTRTMLNVNMPLGALGRPVITVQGRRESEDVLVEDTEPAREQAGQGWIVEAPSENMDHLTDIEAIRHGLVSLTPLHCDTTHHAAVRSFQRWETILKDH